MLQRRLDSWLGIPLVAALGGVNRVRRFFSPARPPEKARRIGVLALGAIGDLLLATGLLAGLRRALPEAEMEIITSKANAACRSLLRPEYEAAAFSVKDIPGMVSHIRSRNYDIFIDMGQWARISALVTALSGAGVTAGFATPGQRRHFAYDLTVPHRNDTHEADNFLALGRALFPMLEGEPEIVVPETLPAGGISLPEHRCVFCHMWPSGLHSHLKEWPKKHWAELARALRDAGYLPVFTGGPVDVAATEAFLREYALEEGPVPVLSAAGKTSLPELAYHVKRAAAVVSVNTGIMHLAALAGAPTIGLHGPTNPLRWGPVGLKTRSLLPREGNSAYLNLGFEYPPGADEALRHLPVADVLQALRDFGLSL